MLALLLFGDTKIDPAGHVHITDVLVSGLYQAPELESKLSMVQLDTLNLDTSTHNDTISVMVANALYKDTSSWNDTINTLSISYLIQED